MVLEFYLLFGEQFLFIYPAFPPIFLASTLSFFFVLSSYRHIGLHFPSTSPPAQHYTGYIFVSLVATAAATTLIFSRWWLLLFIYIYIFFIACLSMLAS